MKYKDKVTQRRKSVGPACAKRLTKVMEYTELEDWINAEKLLTDSLKSTTNRGCRPGFEHSQINRYLGYVYYAQDKIELAIEAYMSVVNEPGLIHNSELIQDIRLHSCSLLPRDI